MENLIGARYQVVRVLGRGAFGVVYLARDRELGRSVAVKLLTEAGQARDRARFRREATVTARLKSPHVVRLLDHGEHESQPFVVYEFVEGEDLRRRLRDGAVARDQALAWALQGCAGLTEAHAQGVVHRDLKPENAMVRAETGELVLCDFGLAADDLAGTRLTQTDAGAPGTPLYIALEQLDGAATLASDQFSWALVVYELLTGEPLRESRELFARLAALLATLEHELPPSAKERLGAFDAPLRRALAPDPAARFESMEAFGRALQAAASPERPAATPAPPPVQDRPTPGSAAPPQPPNGRGRAAALGLLGLLLAAGTAWRALPRRPPPPPPPSPSPTSAGPPEELRAAYRRLAGPLLDGAGELRHQPRADDLQEWVLDERLALRWRSYLRSLRPWLARAPEDPAVLPFARHLPAALGDHLLAARDRGQKLVLTGVTRGGVLARATTRRKELAAICAEELGPPRGTADLVLLTTLAARDLIPPELAAPLSGQVARAEGPCPLLRWAFHELAVAAPADALGCAERAVLLARGVACGGPEDPLVIAARARDARACPGEAR